MKNKFLLPTAEAIGRRNLFAIPLAETMGVMPNYASAIGWIDT